MDLSATIGKDLDDEAMGVPHGRLLVDYAEAAVRSDAGLADLRSQLLLTLGPAAAGHAAATVTAFSGLVRVADATGIPIDDGLARASAEIRTELGLEEYGGAGNSDVAHIDAGAFTTIDALFDNSV